MKEGISNPFENPHLDKLARLNEIVLDQRVVIRTQAAEIASLRKEVARLSRLVVNDDVIPNFYSEHGIWDHLGFYLAERRRVARGKSQPLPSSFLIMDLDNFHAVNNTWGHSFGNEYLTALGQTINNRLRRDADFAGRLGGDEIGVFLLEANLSGAKWMAEKLRQAVTRIKLPSPEGTPAWIRQTVSIGVTEIRTDDTERSILDRGHHMAFLAKHWRNKVYAEGDPTTDKPKEIKNLRA